jgi:hypothetical protein
LVALGLEHERRPGDVVGDEREGDRPTLDPDHPRVRGTGSTDAPVGVVGDVNAVALKVYENPAQ